MAELHFFMTTDDTADFTKFLIKRFNARLALDGSEDPEPRVYSETDPIIRLLKASTYALRFFVLSDLWQRYPLSISKANANDGRVYYSIDQRYGGPAFDFLVSHGKPDENHQHQYIVPGWFSDYPWYIKNKSFLTDRTTYETFNRPDEMKSAFREVQTYIRKTGVRSVCKETGKIGPWILPQALEENRKGIWMRQGDWHFEQKT